MVSSLLDNLVGQAFLALRQNNEFELLLYFFYNSYNLAKWRKL
jgi:hypothetical protein